MTDPITEAANAITRMAKGISGVGSKSDSVSGDKLAQKLPKSKPISGSANSVSRPQGNRVRSFRETYFDEETPANSTGENIRLFDPLLMRRKRRRNLFRMSQDID